MKKRVIITIIIFINLIFSLFGEEGFIWGKILKENRCSHDGITVRLYGADMKLIGERKSIITGDFYFKNIENGKYHIEIEDKNKIVKREFIKNQKNIKLKAEKIESGKDEYILYSFTYFLYLIGLIINIIILVLLKKGLDIAGKKYIYWSIYFFTFTFIVQIILFGIGILNEEKSSYFMPLTDMAGIAVPILMYKFFMSYPVKKKEKIYSVTYYIGLISSILISAVELSKIYTRTIYIHVNTVKEIRKLYSYIYDLWDIELILLIGGAVIILIHNMIKYKNKSQGEISKSCLKYGITIFVVVFFGSTLINRVWDIPFDNYIDLIYVLTDILLFTGILTGILGFKMLDRYKKWRRLFSETLKTAVIILICFILNHYKFIENIYLLPVMLGLKYILDYIFNIYYKINVISRESYIRKLENSYNFKMVEKEISEIIREKIGINKVYVLTEINGYKEVEKLKKESETDKEKVFFTSKTDIAEEYKKYKIGIKMVLEGKVKGVIFIGEKEDGKIIKRKEMDFLTDIAEYGAYAVNRVMSYENKKDEFNGEQNMELLKEREKKRETIEYGISYADRILQNLDNKEKIEKYCRNLKTAMEELKKDDTNER